MTTGTLLYEGKAKKIFTAERADQVVHYFKDDATAFNAQKRGTIVDKGVINNKVSERLFTLLEADGIPTHFVEAAQRSGNADEEGDHRAGRSGGAERRCRQSGQTPGAEGRAISSSRPSWSGTTRTMRSAIRS